MNQTPDRSKPDKPTKTPEEQLAEDIAYTWNHSIYCTITDFINPPINAATDGYLRWLIPGCGHDHSADHQKPHAHDHGHKPPCKHHHHHEHKHGPSCHHHHEPVHQNLSRWEKVKAASKTAFSKERFLQYAKGEFIGDFGAVPITIGVQRLFPGFMRGVRALTEPVAGPVFKWGTQKSTERWARRNQIEFGSDEFKQQLDKVYEHEMSHFPQAVVWTGASLGLNVAYQMHSDSCTHIPFWNKLALKTSSVLSGVLVTAGVVVAARALAPHQMRRFDEWTGRNIILPVTEETAGLLGVDKKKSQELVEEENALWADRVNNERKQSVAR